MPGLQKKARQRTLGEKRKLKSMTISDPTPSVSSFGKGSKGTSGLGTARLLRYWKEN